MPLFFAVVPLRCYSISAYECFCHYYQELQANVYNCSSKTATALPPSVEQNTNYLIVSSVNITCLCDSFDYFDEIELLDVSRNNISSVCDKFWNLLEKSANIKYFNLAGNNIRVISKKLRNIKHLRQVWLSDNPFHCDCGITWMKDLLNNFTTPTGEHIIVDYKDVKCKTGMMIGKALYNLNEVDMGCFPSKWTTWQKIGVGIGAVVAVILILLTIVITKRSRELKFLIYYYFKVDTIPKDDKNENVDNMEYDAFFCYRLLNNIILSSTRVSYTPALDSAYEMYNVILTVHFQQTFHFLKNLFQ